MRHIQWMARERLSADLEDFTFHDNKSAMAQMLDAHATHLTDTATQLRTEYTEIEHFGDS